MTNERENESPLVEAIRVVHEQQAASPIPLCFYIFEDDDFVLHVHKNPPAAGLCHLMVRADGVVNYIAGLDSKLGTNAAEILRLAATEQYDGFTVEND